TSPTTLEHVAAFELVWLRELGYSPRLDSCAVCGKVVPPEATQIGFSQSVGGIACRGCLENVPDRRRLRRITWEALVALAAGTIPTLEPTYRTEVRSILEQMVSHLLGKRPKLAGYLQPT
ncbi:MAG: DNA repair protein RecO, partial [Gemmataceae bacterium]